MTLLVVVSFLSRYFVSPLRAEVKFSTLSMPPGAEHLFRADDGVFQDGGTEEE